MTPKRKATLSVMLIILGLSGIFLYQKNTLYQENLNQSMQQNIDETRLLVDHNLTFSKTLFRAQLQHLTSHHHEILDAFSHRDREKLYTDTIPVFEALKELFPELSNMHFHLPDGHSFLRVHRRNEYGDDLTFKRPMIAQMHLDHQPKNGYEIGVHGLYYRIAEPILVDGQYIGALELGFQPQVLLHDIESILGIEVGLFLPVDAGSKNAFTSPKFTVFNCQNSPVFSTIIDPATDLVASRKINWNGTHFLFYQASVIRDFRGQTAGYLVIAQDIEKQISEQRRFVLSSCLITLILVIAAYMVLHLTFGLMIQKIISLNQSLEQKVKARTRDLWASKKNTEHAMAELQQIFNTAAGGMRVLDKNFRTIKINKTFEKMIGLPEKEIIGTPCYELFTGELCHTEDCTLKRILNGVEHIELKSEKKRQDGTRIPCLLTATPFRSPDGELLGIIEDFKDITPIENLLDQQKINIELAQRVLSLVNSNIHRYTPINESTALFSDYLFATCNIAGGDHCFVRKFGPQAEHPNGRTVISLKDQSGHEVNCVLKSIATDILHNIILHASDCSRLECEVNKLNRDLCASGMFNDDEFITAIHVEVDHATMMMRYISCGHPPFVLIRNGQISLLPDESGQGHSLPLAVANQVSYTAAELQLQVGDQLVFYTDGLTDMPLQHTGRVIAPETLRDIIAGIHRNDDSLHVSELINELYREIAQRCGETMIPFRKNTSQDDITLLGLEVENTSADETRQLYIKNIDDFTAHIGTLHSAILAQTIEKNFVIAPHLIWAALEESIMNAWKHGHGCDAEKPIEIRWRFGNDLHLEVIDQGSGFDYHDTTNPLTQENLLKESGRGLYMIRLYADTVTWGHGGRHITMSFKPTAPWDRRAGLRGRHLNPLDIWNPGSSATREPNTP